MKRLFYLPVLCLAISLGACNSSNHTAAEHTEATEDTMVASHQTANPELIAKIYSTYLILKDDLVKSNAADVKKSAAEIESQLRDVPGCEEAVAVAGKIAGSDELDRQRVLFSDLSNDIVTLVKESAPVGDKIFIQYCPMANGHKGAYWLSQKEKIENPYFGDAMLTCGVTKETLN